MAASRGESVKISDKDPLLGAAYGLSPFASAVSQQLLAMLWQRGRAWHASARMHSSMLSKLGFFAQVHNKVPDDAWEYQIRK
jgi:hypothetical protein